jgi:hypothetical protein
VIAYMVDGNYPHGMLVSSRKIKYYFMEDVPEVMRTFFLEKDVTEVIGLIGSMQFL